MIPTLANHLWQSTLFAAAAGLLTVAFRRNHARARHALWLAASLKFLVPFSIFVGLGSQVGSRTAPVPVVPRVSRVVEQIAEPATYSFASTQTGKPVPLLPIWAYGVVIVAAYRLRQWRRVRAEVRRAAPSPMPFPIPVRSCPGAGEPGVYGIFRPVLLLPKGIAERLSPGQFQAILAHELCHVRRRDNLAAALHMLVETLFWFHPAVWFIGTRLIEERERACDEDVLRLGTEPETYAESILEACRLYLESPLPCVSGVTGADLRGRIERIMTMRRGIDLGLGRRILLAALAAAALAAPVWIGLAHAQSSVFEVASIKPAPPGGRRVTFDYRPDGGFTATNITLAILIRQAYEVMDFQLSGGPAWTESDRFDISAKPGYALTRAQSNMALQSLLADRFHLVVARTQKEMPIYVLTTAKGGLKLEKLDRAPMEGDGDFRAGGGHLMGQGASMHDLSVMLCGIMGRRVQDETGADGIFDVKLDWTPESFRPTDPNRREEHGLPPPDPNGASIFTAMQEQLGLKLESKKGPVEIIVISRAEKPTEN